MDSDLRDLILDTGRLWRQLGVDKTGLVESTACVLLYVRPEMRRDDAIATVRRVLRERLSLRTPNIG